MSLALTYQQVFGIFPRSAMAVPLAVKGVF
jgi:hypothetical protein